LPPESNHTFKWLTTFLSCNFSNYQETDNNCYFLVFLKVMQLFCLTSDVLPNVVV